MNQLERQVFDTGHELVKAVCAAGIIMLAKNPDIDLNVVVSSAMLVASLNVFIEFKKDMVFSQSE